MYFFIFVFAAVEFDNTSPIYKLGKGTNAKVVSLSVVDANKKKLRVAAKIFNFDEDPDRRKRQKARQANEILILSRLKHDNIVKYYGVLPNNNEQYLLMEECNGSVDTIHTWFTENYRIKNLVRQVLTGLAYLHEQFIFHGDVKLHNILYKIPTIDRIDEVVYKLADFESAVDNSEIKSKKGNVVVFTDKFCSNEVFAFIKLYDQLRKHNLKVKQTLGQFNLERQDLFSFGKSVYFMLYSNHILINQLLEDYVLIPVTLRKVLLYI